VSIPSLSGNPSLLVGRERELAVLHQNVDAAMGGHGSLVLIGGEAGIGKTALAEALCRAAHCQGMAILVGRCFELIEPPAYGPWLDLFDRYRPTHAVPPPPVFAQRGTLAPVASQAALFRQLLDFFETACAQRPLVLVLEDLHWADPASLDLLRFLSRALDSLPMLVLATYRDDELGGRPLAGLLPSLVREGTTDRLALHVLDERAVRAWVSGRYQLPGTDASRLVTYLVQRAEGNPFFLGEVLRTLEDDAVLVQEDGRWTLGDLTAVRVPSLLQQVIGQRVRRLSQEAQQLLAIAAVIGHEISWGVWQTVSDTQREALLTVAGQGGAAHLIQETRDGTGVRFVHALIREALYESWQPARRRDVHQRVGEILAALPTPDPDLVAHHFHQAGDARAVAWLLQAGARAEHACAWLSAADRFELALSLMDSAGTSAGRRGWLLLSVARMRRYTDPRHAIRCLDEAAGYAARAGDRLLAAQCVYQRGLMRCIAGDIRRGLSELEDGITARRVVAAEERVRRDELPHDMRDFDVSGNDTLVLWLAIAGRYAEARARGEQLRATTADTSRGMGLVYAALGLPAEAQRAFAHAQAAYGAIGNYINAGNSAGYALLWVTLPYATDRIGEREALVATIADAWQQASGAVQDDLRHLARLPVDLLEGRWDAVQHAAHLQSDVLQWLRWSVCGQVAYWQGDSDKAWALIREVLPDGPQTEPGNCRFLAALPLLRLGAALSCDARDRSAMWAWLDAHDRWLAWSGAVLGRAEGQVMWARYYRLIGDAPAAAARAREALAAASDPPQPLAQLTAHRVLGETAMDTGDGEDALAHLGASLDLAAACAAPYERALSLIALGELHATAGDRAAAPAALAEAREICTSLGATPALARIDALAGCLRSEPPPRSSLPDGLTAREVDVLRLVAAGQSNREIAATLFISIRTVNRHIENLYRKIGAHGRADATTYAVHHRLA
jgi:DNA-binding CsgD family transcriptional regulator